MSCLAILIILIIIILVIVKNNRSREGRRRYTIYRFYRDTCPYCVERKHIWKSFTDKNADKEILFVDVDVSDPKNVDLQNQFKVDIVPTLWSVRFDGKKTKFEGSKHSVSEYEKYLIF